LTGINRALPRCYHVAAVVNGRTVMRAMVLERPGERLQMRELLDRAPGPGEVRLAVSACGVCRTICTSTANCRTRSYR